MKPATKDRLRKAMHDPLAYLVVVAVALLIAALFDMQGIWISLSQIFVGAANLIEAIRGYALGGERQSRRDRIIAILCGALLVTLGIFDLLNT